MVLRFNNLGYHLGDLMRRCGYRPLATTPEGELNCVRPLGGDYPRFHVYVSADEKIITMTVHLDQKKPSYEGTAAHGGEYDGEIIEEEVARIREVIFELK